MHAASVLILDPDSDAAQRLASKLVVRGYLVQHADNPRHALRLMSDHAIALLIVRWNIGDSMPLEFCRALRELDSVGASYTILLADDVSDADFDRACDAGADDLLEANGTVREILARLHAGQRIVELEQNLARMTRDVVRYSAELEVNHLELARANQRLQDLSYADELTGIRNRRAGIRDLNMHWAASLRHREPLALIALDLDHFKAINDEYGHAIGDLALKHTAMISDAVLRREEAIYRMGGEEFLIMCPRATVDEAAQAAERLRVALEKAVVTNEGSSFRVTASFGVAMRDPQTESIDDLLRCVDEALYAAKRGGRNCVYVSRGSRCEALHGDLDEPRQQDAA
ncbi:MAG: diguanylate cyclase [Planctomycetota bacterium]